MAFDKITYCELEGTPCLVTRAGRGEYVFEHVGGTWREPADNGADVVTKARTLSQEQFERMFPDLELPNAP